MLSPAATLETLDAVPPGRRSSCSGDIRPPPPPREQARSPHPAGAPARDAVERAVCKPASGRLGRRGEGSTWQEDVRCRAVPRSHPFRQAGTGGCERPSRPVPRSALTEERVEQVGSRGGTRGIRRAEPFPPGTGQTAFHPTTKPEKSTHADQGPVCAQSDVGTAFGRGQPGCAECLSGLFGWVRDRRCAGAGRVVFGHGLSACDQPAAWAAASSTSGT
jgi:hypothetical protein